MLPPHSEPATWPGIHLDVVAECREPLERAEEILRAFARRDREIGPRCVADEERVAGQDELVADDERAVLRPVARRVQDADLGRARAHDRRRRRAARTGTRASASEWIATGRPCSSAKPAVARDVVGVRVRLEHALDADVLLRGRLEVLLDRECRVDDDRDGGVAVSDQVRGAPEVVVDELPEDEHRALSLVRQAAECYRPR